MSRPICRFVIYQHVRATRQVCAPSKPLEPRVRDWLETQSVVVEDWLNQLVAANGDERLVGILCQHAAFLREAAND